MRKIKILQFPIANSYGGITHYALNNWYHMDHDKFDCDFATMSKHLDFEDEILASGANIHYISCYSSENKEQFIKEINAILDNGYDVVHLHTKQWKDFLVEEICKERGVPKVIVHSHSTRCDNNDEAKRLEETRIHEKVRAQFNESLATDFWACSKVAAEWLFGDAIPKDRIRILHNAIETDKYIFNSEIRGKKRKELGLSDEDYIIGNVGRLCYQKNQEFLLEVFSKAFGGNDNVKLLLIGEGERRSDFERLAYTLNISEQVLFLGKREDVNDLYQAIDLFVLPSRFEGLPISIIEAQSSGLMCVASDTITTESAITENVLFCPLEENAWIKCLEELYPHIHGKRRDIKDIITAKGYDLKRQITIVEKGYMDGIDY